MKTQLHNYNLPHTTAKYQNINFKIMKTPPGMTEVKHSLRVNPSKEADLWVHWTWFVENDLVAMDSSPYLCPSL